MKNRASPELICACLLLLSGCYGHTDFVIVEPVRFVSTPATPVPSAKFGWVETTSENAERFRVRVGDLTYQRIIEPHKTDGKITTEKAISAFSRFAEKEVVQKQLCSAASTPVEAQHLIGSNTPPEMFIYVECNK